MNEILIKVIQIYQSPFLVFAGRFEFANLYNLILLGTFISVGVWFVKRARSIAANIRQGRSIFADVTPNNLEEKFDDINMRLREGALTKAWAGFSSTFVIEKQSSPSGEERKQIYATSDASQFFNEDKLIRMNHRLFGALPGIFIGLGILGTFMGLTFGLQGLDFSNSALIRQSMEKLLGGMLIAFSSSVWGITLSICFTSLEKWATNELETKILQLQDTINSVFSLTTQEVYLNHLLEESREQSRALKSFSTDLADAVKRGVGEAVNEDIASAVNRLSDVVEKLNDFKQETTTEAVEHLIERFNEQLMGAAHTQFDRLAQAAENITDMLNHVTGELQTGIELMAESSTQAVDTVLQQTQAWVQSSESRLSDVASQREVELNEILTVMREVQSVITESNKSLRQTQDSTASMEKLIENLHGVTEGFGQVAGEVRQAHEAYSETTERFIGNSEQQHAVTEQMLSQIQGAVETMPSLWEAYEKKLDQTRSDMEKVLDTLSNGVLDYQAAVDQGLQSYITTTRNSLGDYLGQVDDQLARSAQLLGGAISSLSEGVDEINDAIGKIHNNGSGQQPITV